MADFRSCPKRSVGIGTATLGLIVIFVAMTLLATVRNRFPESQGGNRGVFPARARESDFVRGRSNDSSIDKLLAAASGTCCGSPGLAESGSLKIISPGRARPISSRAMRSMALGSVLSELTWSAEGLIFRVHLADLLADLFDFLLRAAHGDEPVRAENVVHQQGEQREAQNLPRVSPQVALPLRSEKVFGLFTSIMPSLPARVHDPGLAFRCAIFDDSSSVAASV